ncbi:MAG: VIT domain-containing protein, partial [Thermodesulfobacteriota bacterium]
MKTRAVFYAAILLSMLLMACGAAAQEPEGNDRTLSPYFYVKDEGASLDSFPLKQTRVRASVCGVIASVVVTQQYENRGSSPINARYVFPASTRAAVHAMTMKIGEDLIKAQVQEKKMARQTFEAAKHEGKSASLLEQERPNVFTMDVANIMPGDVVVIELSYTELLIPSEGVYSFVFPTVVGPRYKSCGTGETSLQAWLENPFLKQGNITPSSFDIQVDLSTGIPIQDLSCKTHETDLTWRSESRASVRLSSADTHKPDRDFILRYRLTGNRIQSGLLVRQGEQENFFLLMMEPPERVAVQDIPGREYIFVVDVSGSMHGFPLNIAKTLIRDLVGSLRPTDRFNLLLFSGSSRLMSPESVPATPDKVWEALGILNSENGGGGTETYEAMSRALSLPGDESLARTIVLVTDGYISAERSVFRLVSESLGHANVFAFGVGSSVNRYLIEGVAKAGLAEPFVVTDPSDAASAANKFREYIKYPLLTDIRVESQGAEIYDLEPRRLPDMFAQRPIVVAGKFRGSPRGAVTVSGLTASGPYEQTFRFDEADDSENTEALPYLWARTRLFRLSDDRLCDPSPQNEEEIIRLGLAYNLLTEKTSFVAVHEEVRNTAAPAQNVAQPLQLPKGVSNLAVGGYHSVPEPGMWVLLVTLALLSSVKLLIMKIKERKG